MYKRPKDCRIRCSTSHVCGQASSEKIFHIFNKQSKTTAEKRCKCVNLCGKTDGKHKMKRLRTYKERSRIRGGGREKSKSKAPRHHGRHRQSSKSTAFFQSRSHSSYHCPPRKDANIVPATQEPSIITDSRLIGHHGLFHHEVKSIDIERLLSEQRKLEKKSQQGIERNDAATHPSATPDNDEALPLENKAAQKNEKENSQESDLTPGQRNGQQLDLSSASFKNTSLSKNRSDDGVVMIKRKEPNPATSEKDSDSQPIPTVFAEKAKRLDRKVKRKINSTLECTPKNQESPVHQTQAHSLGTSSPHTADNVNKQVPDSVFKSVSAVAAALCDCVPFPLLRRRNLEAESRDVLLKALRDRHRPRLQENLLQVQRGHSIGGPAEKHQDQEPIRLDDLFPPDAFTMSFQANAARRPCFNAQKATSFQISGGRSYNCKSTPQPHQNREQTANWLVSPTESAVSFLDDALRPTCSPPIQMDFELSGGTASDRLFFPPYVSPHWEDSFNRPKGSKSLTFDALESNFMNHTRPFPQRSSHSQYSGGSNTQPFFPYQTQLPDRRSAEPVHFPRENQPFEPDQYTFAPAFSGPIHRPQQSFQPVSQFIHTSSCPPLMSYHSDMTHYPPSHMLERDPAAPLSHFPSPESWSFPPMRLY